MANHAQLEHHSLVRWAAFLSGLLFAAVLVMRSLTAFTIQDPPPESNLWQLGSPILIYGGGRRRHRVGGSKEVVQEAEQEEVAAAEPVPDVRRQLRKSPRKRRVRLQ